jgi:hypothetical protein
MIVNSKRYDEAHTYAIKLSLASRNCSARVEMLSTNKISEL